MYGICALPGSEMEENEQLRADLEAAKAEIETHWQNGADFSLHIVKLEKQLAARDLVIKQLQGHMNLYRLFSCEGSDSYDPECAELNLDKVQAILKSQPTTEALDEFVQRAVLEEREACALVCEQRVDDDGQTDDWGEGWSTGWNGANYGAAEAIRGRGK